MICVLDLLNCQGTDFVQRIAVPLDHEWQSHHGTGSLVLSTRSQRAQTGICPALQPFADCRMPPRFSVASQFVLP